MPRVSQQSLRGGIHRRARQPPQRRNCAACAACGGAAQAPPASLGSLTRVDRGGAQSFQRLTSQLQPRTRVRLIAALNLHHDGGDEARERHGLSGDAVLAWREQAAAAGRGAGRGARGPPPVPRRRSARSEEGSEDSRSGSESGSGSGSESGSEYDDDAEAEYEALARIAREWEAAERERAAREEDAKDLATMMRLCCIAMKPTSVPADKGEGRMRNTAPPMRQRNGSSGAAAPRAPPPPPPYREPPAVEARRAREERDTSQNRHRHRGTGRAPRDY